MNHPPNVTVPDPSWPRVLICEVPKPQGDDKLAEKGVNAFAGIVPNIGGQNRSGGSLLVPQTAKLDRVISAWKLHAEIFRQAGTLVVIGHGSAVYTAVNNNDFAKFLSEFKKLESVIFISCELDKGHPEVPGFQANIVDLLVQHFKTKVKVYAAKTNVGFSVIKAQSFVCMGGTYVVPALNTGIVKKNPHSNDVDSAMDIFFYD